MPRKKERIRRKVIVGRDAVGNPVVKWAIGYTNKEVEARKDELIREYATGATAKQAEMLYKEYVQLWYNAYKKGRLSESSKRSYANAINNHVLPYIGDKQLRAVSAIDLQNILNRLEGKSKSLIGDVYSIIKNVAEHACANGIIDRNPALSLAKPQAAAKKPRRALTEAETAAALKVGAEHPRGLLLLLLYYTGMRRGEALGLQWGDVDFDARTIRVNRDIDFISNGPGSVKTAQAYRAIPIPQALYDVLRPLRGLPSVYVIQAQGGSFLNQSSYKRLWAKLMAAMLDVAPDIEKNVVEVKHRKVRCGTYASGKPKYKDTKTKIYGSMLTPHYFRHNYTSVLYNAGVDVLTAQKILGHSDPKTTISIYTHLSKENMERDIHKICNAFGASPESARNKTGKKG